MNKKETKEKEKQLDLGLKNAPQNIFYKYKDRYDIWIAGLETKKFIKDPLTWFVLILSLTLIFTQIYNITEIERIPTEIPIFNYFLNYSKRLTSKEWIYTYPAMGTFVLLVGLFISNTYYHKEKLLSRTLLLIILLTNISLCIVFMKLLFTF